VSRLPGYIAATLLLLAPWVAVAAVILIYGLRP
jgi:hypothetical protein